ncbi:hypothetical protein F5876DRAFT_80312 [Lentinula aff. lateritia]|uniref:Uncharacterized protein n=1 Tax=Lentinula aff. lateritia TaxID=2804960 RepID=A0ACC1TQN4_9AGAR|nr:hypothetical protein F5876DRAFT_80312 [Lentinula aff. lateritia]
MRFNATVCISLVVFLASASVSASPTSPEYNEEVDATITHNARVSGQEHIWTLMRQVFEEKHGWTWDQANHLNLRMVHDDSISTRQDGKTFFAEGMPGVTRKCKGVVNVKGGQLAYVDNHEVYYSYPGNTLLAFPSRRSRKNKPKSISRPVEQYHIPGAFPTEPPMLLPL